MNKAEFDKFAEEYKSIHARNIKLSGEKPDFFAEYKVFDTALLAKKYQLNNSSIRIMDFGAGVGNSVPFFKKHFLNADLVCLDVSEKSLEIAKERFPNQAEFVLFDGRRIPYDNDTFDVVFVACVFHHIDASQHNLFLKEILRVLVSGGILVIFEHNPYNPLTLQAVNTCVFDKNAKLIKARDFKHRLMVNDFKNVLVKYRIFFPRALKRARFLEPFMTWIPFGAQYYVVGNKK